MDTAERKRLEEFVWPISVCCLLIAFALGLILAIRC